MRHRMHLQKSLSVMRLSLPGVTKHHGSVSLVIRSPNYTGMFGTFRQLDISLGMGTSWPCSQW